MCNVCHRHEKHRSLRLLQSVTPPCPFCAHGVTTVEALGPDKIQHQRKSLPVISPHTFNPHPLTQFQQHMYQGHGPYGGQGLAGNDTSDGYPYNRQYHPTYSMYGPHTAPLLRTGSGPSDMSMSTRPGMTQFGHGHHQPTHMKPPTGPMMKPSPSYAKNIFVPTFQPSSSYGMEMGCIGSMDNMSMGRLGMVGPSTGNWKDGSTQDFTNDQFHRGKHQNCVPGYLPTSFATLPNLTPAIPPTVPRTEAIQWAVVRVTNVSCYYPLFSPTLIFLTFKTVFTDPTMTMTMAMITDPLGCVIAGYGNLLCWNPNPTRTFAITERAYSNGPSHRENFQLGIC